VSAFFQDFLSVSRQTVFMPIPAGHRQKRITHTLKDSPMNSPIKIASSIALMLVALQPSTSRADDKSEVGAASDAFYSALSVLDDGTAMSGVFAQTPYITFVGPRTKDVIVGWPALKNYFVKANATFNKRETRLESRAMHVSGTFAWEVGLEVGDIETKDGKKMSVSWVATNIFEKQPDGNWLMVSHHVQPGADR
jgi:ketosteroid isomerase-like protein